ncbi:MAG: J domain-containing protein [Novosphingobium sp.]
MGKLLFLVLLASLATKWLSGRWPWQLMHDSERSQKEAMARMLLGVDRSASRADIAEAHRRLLAKVHPDRGGTNEAVHQAAAARDVLLARLDRQETGPR